MKSSMNFYKLDRIRKCFVYDNCDHDHVFCVAKSKVLLSAPHAVSQVRLGKQKPAEIGSLKTVLCLAEESGASYIVKTKNNVDDANWDDESKYKHEVWNIVENNNIKYILDFHGLASERDCDIDLGTNLGFNIEKDVKAFDWLVKALTKAGFKVSIDQPFKAGNNTVSWSTKKRFDDVWACQIEVNTSITHRPENFDKFKKMINVFVKFIKLIDGDGV